MFNVMNALEIAFFVCVRNHFVFYSIHFYHHETYELFCEESFMSNYLYIDQKEEVANAIDGSNMIRLGCVKLDDMKGI